MRVPPRFSSKFRRTVCGLPIDTQAFQETMMGKGDRKTAKGKRYNSSYGNARSKATTKSAGTASAPVAKKAAAKTVSKAPAKKVVAKKAAG
jgi:30S ribosomal protein S31